MCQALIPTSWFMDYWPNYRSQAVLNNDEAATLADELEDDELQIDAAAARIRLGTPGEAHEEALRLRDRLVARRDPVRLKEHLFWLMWHFMQRGDFEQSVAVCDEGIALAKQLGSPPVQYSSIKGLALTSLGRFDQAWTSFHEELADAQHPFGRCMRELGLAVWLESVGAFEQAETKAKEVLDEAGRLLRTWMQQVMIDLLAVIAARRGVDGAGLRARQAARDRSEAQLILSASALRAGPTLDDQLAARPPRLVLAHREPEEIRPVAEAEDGIRLQP